MRNIKDIKKRWSLEVQSRKTKREEIEREDGTWKCVWGCLGKRNWKNLPKEEISTEETGFRPPKDKRFMIFFT